MLFSVFLILADGPFSVFLEEVTNRRTFLEKRSSFRAAYISTRSERPPIPRNMLVSGFPSTCRVVPSNFIVLIGDGWRSGGGRCSIDLGPSSRILNTASGRASRHSS